MQLARDIIARRRGREIADRRRVCNRPVAGTSTGTRDAPRITFSLHSTGKGLVTDPGGGRSRCTGPRRTRRPSAVALPDAARGPAREALRPRAGTRLRDLRDRGGRSPHGLLFGARRPRRGHRPARQRQVHADAARGRRAAASTPRTPATAGTPRMPRFLPYAVYRPLVRARPLRRTAPRPALRRGRRRARLRHAGLGARLAGPRGPAPRRRPAPAAARRHARHGPGRASASAAGGLARTPSPRHRRAAVAAAARRGDGRPARRAAARRCCSTGTRRTCCGRIDFAGRPPDRSRPAASYRTACFQPEQRFAAGGRQMDIPADPGLPGSRHRRTPIRTADGPATSWRRCSSASLGVPRRRAAASSRCSAAASSGCRCPTAAARDSGPPRPAHAGDRGPGLRPGLQLRGAVPPGRRRPHVVHRRPAVEFARGLPPQVGIAVNPDGAVGVPLPPAAVAELVPRRPHPAGRPGRRRPGPALRARLAGRPGRLPRRRGRPSSRPRASCARARRCLASIEGGRPGHVRRRRTLPVGGRPRGPPDGRPRPGPGPRPGRPGRSTWSSWTWRRTRSATGCGSRCAPSTSGTNGPERAPCAEPALKRASRPDAPGTPP